MDQAEEIPINNKYIDELTMKLLTNKTNYAKYLAKTDTRKYEEQQEFIQDCRTFKDSILDITRRMCKNEEVEYSSAVTHAFDIYARELIRYLEVKQCSDELQKELYKEIRDDDEDVMFPASIDNVMEDDIKPKSKYLERMNTLDFFINSKKK